MKPTTLRLQENTLKALDREAGEYGFDNRTEYIRHILDNRSVVVENTEACSGENTHAVLNRLDELEERVAELEESRDSMRETPARSDSRPRDPYPPKAEDTTAEQPEGDIDDILDGWPGPREEKKERRREVGAAALDWLRDHGRPANASDFKDALLDEHSVEGQSPDTWYRKSVKPALDRAKEAGAVEYREGYHDYEWLASEGVHDGQEDVYDPAKEFE